jgi:hypothetical protein
MNDHFKPKHYGDAVFEVQPDPSRWDTGATGPGRYFPVTTPQGVMGWTYTDDANRFGFVINDHYPDQAAAWEYARGHIHGALDAAHAGGSTTGAFDHQAMQVNQARWAGPVEETSDLGILYTLNPPANPL